MIATQSATAIAVEFFTVPTVYERRLTDSCNRTTLSFDWPTIKIGEAEFVPKGARS